MDIMLCSLMITLDLHGFIFSYIALNYLTLKFANMIRTQFSCPIETLRINNALEYKDFTLLSFLSQHGTIVQRCYPHTCQQNRRVECKHYHILDSISALLLYTFYPEKFWGEVALTLVYTINRLPSYVLHNISPFERLYRTPPNYFNLEVFCCACFVLLHPHEHTKLKPHAYLCYFIGCGTKHKGFRCWDHLSKRLCILYLEAYYVFLFVLIPHLLLKFSSFLH
ncbi:hypothetical protein IC575_026339 [Cucumis melo]